jgi:hypothetical protein
MSKRDILKEIEDILKETQESTDIPNEYGQQLSMLFSDQQLLAYCKRILNPEFVGGLNYETLKSILEVLQRTTEKLNSLSEEIDIQLFLQEGYKLDYEALMEKFKQQNLGKKFPNFNLKRLCELYENPIKNIEPYHSKKEKIYINPTVWRKFTLSMLQMVFNEMDLLIVYTGKEGAGKSTLCTQHMFIHHWMLNEFGISNYPYKIKDMMFNSLGNLRVTEDDHFGDKFRQLALDEGNELHRQNWKDEEVQTFFQRLRRERFNQRIKYICIPVLGELMTNIVMSRVNFIFEVEMEAKSRMGILKKGKCNFYIIPRSNRIYSHEHRKEFTEDFIKQELYEVLKDKSYLKGLPKNLIISKFTFNGVAGFNREQYNKELKETNKSFSVKEGIKINNTTIYVLYRLLPRLRPKVLGLKSVEPEYASYHKLTQNVRKYMIDNPRAKHVEEEKFNLKYGDRVTTIEETEEN